MSAPLLWAGLGNPGAEHARDRHNIGFMALAAVAERHGFPAWRGKFEGELSDGRIGGAQVRLLRPLTYMNESGRSVAQAARFHRVEARDVLVIHDELDLAAGKVRLKRGGGDAGHNGLRSITAALGPDYRRLRLGVGRGAGSEASGGAIGRVLSPFSAAEREGWLAVLLGAVAENAALLAANDDLGDSRFLNAVASAMAPAPAPATAAPKGGAESGANGKGGRDGGASGGSGSGGAER